MKVLQKSEEKKKLESYYINSPLNPPKPSPLIMYLVGVS